MAGFQFKALTLFLILLGVLLLGVLMHHTWESFVGKETENFESDFLNSSDASKDLFGLYSTNNTTVAKLTEGLYFDPTQKVLIESSGNNLKMKLKDGRDLSYNAPSVVDMTVVDLGMGKIKFTGNVFTLPDFTLTTLADAKARFKLQSIQDKYIYMDVTFKGTTTLDTDLITNCRVAYSQNPISKVAANTTSYPALIADSTANMKKFTRVTSLPGLNLSLVETQNTPVKISWYTSRGYGVISIPILKDGVQTNTNFIHVMDIKNNKHVAQFFFQGNQVEKYVFTDVPIVNPRFYSIPSATDQTNVSTSTLVFTGTIEEVSLPKYNEGGRIYVDTYHDETKELIFIAGRVDNNVFRAYIKIGSISTIEIVTSESSSSATSYNAGYTGSYSSGSSSSSSSSVEGSFNELKKSLVLIKNMEILFGGGGGRKNSDYMLKTEVVPPVCPSCHSCSDNDVCTNCGGNGGSGTYTKRSSSKKKSSGGSGAQSIIRDAGSGATNLIRDGVGGVTDLGRDAGSGASSLIRDGAGGVTSIGREVVSGTKNTISDVTSGAGNFLKDSGSGIGNFAKDSASGVFGAAKDAVGGTVGLGREVVGGTMDAVGGVGKWFQGLPSANSGGYQNSYGGPNHQIQQNQGGYLNPRIPGTSGQDPYSYYGSVPYKNNDKYVPITADFSAFGR